MRYLPAAVPISMILFGFSAISQENPAGELRHMQFSSPSGNRIAISAMSMTQQESAGKTAHVIRLKGNVEVRITVCRANGTSTSCDGSVVIKADEADYNVDSGEVEPRGNVRVTPGPVN